MSAGGADRLVVVGQIAGAFGVKGEVKVRSFTEDPEACFSYGPLMDEHGAVVLTPVRHRPLKDLFGVIAKEPLQREAWDAIKGVLLHVPRSAMPDEGDDDEYYVVDLIGCALVHADGRSLGKVRNVPDFGAGSLLEIEAEGGAVFYLQFGGEPAPVVDLDARRITVDVEEDLLPEALQRQPLDGGTN